MYVCIYAYLFFLIYVCMFQFLSMCGCMHVCKYEDIQYMGPFNMFWLSIIKVIFDAKLQSENDFGQAIEPPPRPPPPAPGVGIPHNQLLTHAQITIRFHFHYYYFLHPR